MKKIINKLLKTIFQFFFVLNYLSITIFLVIFHIISFYSLTFKCIVTFYYPFYKFLSLFKNISICYRNFDLNFFSLQNISVILAKIILIYSIIFYCFLCLFLFYIILFFFIFFFISFVSFHLFCVIICLKSSG